MQIHSTTGLKACLFLLVILIFHIVFDSLYSNCLFLKFNCFLCFKSSSPSFYYYLSRYSKEYLNFLSDFQDLLLFLNFNLYDPQFWQMNLTLDSFDSYAFMRRIYHWVLIFWHFYYFTKMLKLVLNAFRLHLLLFWTI
jgi:hypothetical protein